MLKLNVVYLILQYNAMVRYAWECKNAIAWQDENHILAQYFPELPDLPIPRFHSLERL